MDVITLASSVTSALQGILQHRCCGSDPNLAIRLPAKPDSGTDLTPATGFDTTKASAAHGVLDVAHLK